MGGTGGAEQRNQSGNESADSIQCALRRVAKTTLGDDIPGEVDGDQIKVALDMPAIARAGIHYAPTGSAWSFDAGFVYEEWSRAAQIRFRPQGIAFVGATPEPELIPEIYVKTGFQDAWSIRFGGTRDLEEMDAQLYLGSFYETGASSELGITPASMDLDKVGISAGWHQVLAAGVSLDFAIAHQEWLTREVTDGQARLIDRSLQKSFTRRIMALSPTDERSSTQPSLGRPLSPSSLHFPNTFRRSCRLPIGDRVVPKALRR